MFTQPLFPNLFGATTVIDRPPLRTLRKGAAWLAIGMLMSSAACTSLQVNAGAPALERYSSLAPAPATSRRVTLASAHAGPASSLYAPNIAIGDSLLSATVTRLREMSPAFDSAIVAIENSGIPVVIGTATQLRDQLPPGYGSVGGWQALTAVYPLTPSNARGKPIDHFAVIVRLTDLRAALHGDATKADSALFTRFVERVLAHEIYGHIMPQLAMGKTAPIACDDPTSGATWYSACVMRRERHVMAEVLTARGTFATIGTR